MTGDPRFHALLKEIGDLHDKKQSDYGTGADPFANVRGSIAWGVKPWVGAMVRANDKIKRLQKYAVDGRLANESARDSFLDGAVYMLIGLILHDEAGGSEHTREQPDIAEGPSAWGYPKPPPACGSNCSCRVDIC